MRPVTAGLVLVVEARSPRLTAPGSFSLLPFRSPPRGPPHGPSLGPLRRCCPRVTIHMDDQEMVSGWFLARVRRPRRSPSTWDWWTSGRSICSSRKGFYTNRTDFIRTAIRTQLATRAEALGQSAARRTLTLGSCHYTRRDLEQIRDTGQLIQIRVLGLASIAADVSPQLALATIASVEVLGAFRAPAAVKAALAARTT